MSVADHPTFSSKGVIKATILLIAWDQCTTFHNATLEVLDYTLQDLIGIGGINWGFQQTHPLTLKGTKADELQAYIKSSYIWIGAQKHCLGESMWV